jgi:hypothetical protein
VNQKGSRIGGITRSRYDNAAVTEDFGDDRVE